MSPGSTGPPPAEDTAACTRTHKHQRLSGDAFEPLDLPHVSNVSPAMSNRWSSIESSSTSNCRPSFQDDEHDPAVPSEQIDADRDPVLAMSRCDESPRFSSRGEVKQRRF